LPNNEPGNDGMPLATTFDPIWENIYADGKQLNLYPYSGVVSFVFRYRTQVGHADRLRILEIGCGAANNLWFAAREGHEVFGIDASSSAIEFAKNRFDAENLEGTFITGDFTDLPFTDNFFDFAINRAAISQTGGTAAKRAVDEVFRVLKPTGKFYNEIYSDTTTRGGRNGPDGVTIDITGPLAGVGQIKFYSRAEIGSVLFRDWTILELKHHTIENLKLSVPEIVGEWHIVAEKP